MIHFKTFVLLFLFVAKFWLSLMDMMDIPFNNVYTALETKFKSTSPKYNDTYIKIF